MRCARPGKVQAPSMAFTGRSRPSATQAAIAARGVLRIVRAAQRLPMPARSATSCALPSSARTIGCHPRSKPSAAAPRPDTRTTFLPARAMRVGRCACPIVVDADHRSIGICDQPLLDGGVILHRAMAVEVIFRHVKQNTDGGFQRGREIDLVGGNLQHVGAIFRERLERQCRHADIAAHLRIAAGAFEQVINQRRGGRFAVGAGDGDERASSAGFGALAAKQFNVADDLDLGGARQRRGPMRLRMRERYAGGKHQRSILLTNRACADPAYSVRRLSLRPRFFRCRHRRRPLRGL